MHMNSLCKYETSRQVWGHLILIVNYICWTSQGRLHILLHTTINGPCIDTNQWLVPYVNVLAVFDLSTEMQLQLEGNKDVHCEFILAGVDNVIHIASYRSFTVH